MVRRWPADQNADPNPYHAATTRRSRLVQIRRTQHTAAMQAADIPDPVDPYAALHELLNLGHEVSLGPVARAQRTTAASQVAD